MTTDLHEAVKPHYRPDRLNGVDDAFLCLELPEQPMHIMALAILRPAERDGGTSSAITLDDLRRRVARQLDVLPAFRLRVKPLPFSLHHPVFVAVSNLDLDHHIRRVKLLAPGGPEELGQLYADLAERCLDRSRPLWRITLVDALDGGRQALIFEIHHCLMDGAAIRTTFSRLFFSEDTLRAAAPCACRPQRAPGGTRLVVDALADHGWGLAQLPALVRKTKRGMAATRKRNARSQIAVPRPRADTPLCSINAGFTSERRFARSSLPLADVKLVKDAAGVTVNDVVLSVVAGALRDYLERRNDLPDRPLNGSPPYGGQRLCRGCRPLGVIKLGELSVRAPLFLSMSGWRSPLDDQTESERRRSAGILATAAGSPCNSNWRATERPDRETSTHRFVGALAGGFACRRGRTGAVAGQRARRLLL
jgi:diacylglycerol O-acyltransferase / wax synthase